MCVWGGGGGGGASLHPDTDEHRSTVSSPLAVMETVTCCSRPVSPRSLTMRHNNSFPWVAGGVEPIVCTLLRLWMLPLLQRAYINLAGSKQYCRAGIPLPHSTSLGIPAAAIKGPDVVHRQTSSPPWLSVVLKFSPSHH